MVSLLAAIGGGGVIATQALAADHAGRVVRVEYERSRDVYVPGGVFTMGVNGEERDLLTAACEDAYSIPSSELGSNDDFSICHYYTIALEHMTPRRVFVSPFRIDRDEVSVEDYRACVTAGACDRDALTAGDTRYITDAGPMVNVRWGEAQTFCRWRGGGRLPPEAEWERAGRGDGDGPWPWGATPRPDDFNHGKPFAAAVARFAPIVNLNSQLDLRISELQGESDASDGIGILAPPGHYAWGDGPYGTRDMAGNVAEWTADAYLPLTKNGLRTRRRATTACRPSTRSAPARRTTSASCAAGRGGNPSSWGASTYGIRTWSSRRSARRRGSTCRSGTRRKGGCRTSASGA